MTGFRQGVVLSRGGGQYRVLSDGQVLLASLRGRMKRGEDPRVLVGDRVRLAVQPDGSATIEAVEPRRSLLQRRSPGRGHGVRAVAANVDQVIVVGAARQPQWDPVLMDRFLAVAAANRLPTILVINKCDLEPEPHRLAAPYRAAGYTVLLTSVPRCSGLETLRQQLVGRQSVFTGPTGVGKSSLLNALKPGLRLRTAPVSPRSGAGRHTTVAAEMHPFEPAGFVVDTPGLRDIGLWALTPQEVGAAFPEIAAVARQCRFDDCRHLGEPGCAVESALTAGELARSRVESYRALLREAMEAARPWA